jgi:hypothetical protein
VVLLHPGNRLDRFGMVIQSILVLAQACVRVRSVPQVSESRDRFRVCILAEFAIDDPHAAVFVTGDVPFHALDDGLVVERAGRHDIRESELKQRLPAPHLPVPTRILDITKDRP